jgi:hypothetical protein
MEIRGEGLSISDGSGSTSGLVQSNTTCCTDAWSGSAPREGQIAAKPGEHGPSLVWSPWEGQVLWPREKRRSIIAGSLQGAWDHFKRLANTKNVLAFPQTVQLDT